MNKIFKIVWSEAVGAFVVASELAKGHTKSTTVKKTATGLKILFRLTALAVAVWGSAGTAWAAIPEGTATGGATFAIGDGSTSANGTGALAIGNNAQAKTNGALAIGPNSTHTTIANGNNAIAIGVNLQATGQKAIGIGTDTTANGSGAIAIGNNDANRMANQGVNGNGAIGVGSNLTANGNNAIAVGTEAQAKAISAVAVGADTQATGVEAVAIGKGAQATKKSSIAIGKNTQATGEASIVIGSDDHIYGEIKATSRQGIAIGTGAKATGVTQAVAIGPDAIASGTQSTSIGNNTRATGDSSIAIGGDDWNTVRTKQVAAAGNKQVHEVFQELTGMQMRADNISTFKGTTSADAAVAVGVKAYAEGVLSTAFGSGTSATGLGASAFGVGAEASKDKSVAIGAGSNTSTNATAVTTATVNDVTYSGFAGTAHITEGSQVSVGRVGYERQIKHVAPGEISATSTDAINGSQLYHVASQAANPLKFDGDSGTTVERKLGNTLNVKGGATGALTDNNIGVVADNNSNTLRLKLAQNVNLGDAGSLRTGDTIVNNDGVAITGGSSITKAGISAGNKPITNVASGGTTDSNAANIGDVKKAAAAAKTEVQAGTNVASVIKTDGANGQAIYTVNAKGAAVSAEGTDNGLKLTSSEDTTTNVTTYNLDLADKTKASLTKADSALQNIGVQVNGTAAKTLNQTNSTLNFVNGTGTTAENKNGDIAFNVNKANLSVNGGTVSADKNGDEFATAKSVADAINQAVTNSEKTSVVAAGDNTHVASDVSGNQTTYTVHADKTTVSAKTGGKLNVTSVQTANGNQTKTNNYELDLTDDAKAEIAKGVEAKTAVDTQGIGFTADSGSPVTKKLGDSLNIKGDNKNITTKINNGDVQVALNDDISVQNVTAAASVITPKVVAGDSTLTSDGLNITGGPSITKTGISAGNKPITNVASGGTTDSNAANIGDVKKAAAAAKTVVRQGANTSVSSATDAATGATEYTVNAEKSVVQGSSDVTVNAVTNGLTTTYIADLSTTAKASLAKADSAVQKVVSSNPNLTASKTGDTVTLDFSQTPSFSSVTAGNSVLTTDGLKITNGTNSVSLTGAGLSNGGNKITNIADGAADTDAASYKQVKAAKTEVQGGTNVASVTKTDNPTDGHAVYTVNAKGAAVALDSSVDGLKLTSSEDTTTNVTTYNLDLADKTKASLTKADSALQNIGVQVNGTAAKTLNQTNSTLNFVNGTGTTAENKNGDIAFNVNKANLSVNGGTVSADKNGDEFATAKSVADAINQAVTNSEKTSVVAAGDNTHVASDVSGNQTTYTVHADKTTVSAKTGGKLNVTSVQTANGNQTKTNNYELDLTDDAKAEIAKGVEAKTAVDTQGIGFTADSGSPVTKKLGDSLNIKGDNKNITTKINNDNVQVTLNDDISVQNVNAAASVITPKVVAGDSTLTSDGLNITGGPSITKTGISAGNKPITNVASGGTTDSNAANIGDVKKAAAAAKTVVKQGANTSVSSATDAATGATEYTVNAEKSVVQGSSDVTVNAVTNGLTTTYTADLSTTAKASLAKADSAVQKVVSSNPNLTASKTGDTVTLDFSQTPSFTSVTTGNSVLTSDGLKIGSGTNSVSLTNAGLSNGGNKITNIADGAADTDAASFKQVKAAKTEVQAGTNVASVIKTDGANGQAIYTVNAKGAAVSAEGTDNGLKLTSSEDTTTNVTTYNLDLADKTKTSLAKADSALQNIGVQVNGADAKTLTKDDSTLNFVDGTGTTAENKADGIAFNVNKSTLKASTGGLVSADKAGDAFATAADVAQAINEAVANSEKTSVVERGDNTHVVAVEAGNKTTYTVHADNTTVSVKDGGKLKLGSSEKANANQTKTTNYELDLTDAAKAEIQKGVDAKEIVDTKGITFSGNSGSPVTKKLDETLAIKGDNKNVVTEAGTDGIKVKLKDDVTLNSVTAETLKAGDSELTAAGLTTPKVTAGDSVLTTDGLKIGADGSSNQVSLTNAGLNNGGNKIAKVAKGTEDTDGVNVSQLNPVAKALNTSINPTTGDVVEPNFTVKQADGTVSAPVHTVQEALDKVGDELGKGLKIAADEGSTEKVNLGDTVTYTGTDGNIKTKTLPGGKVDFGLNDKVTLGKAGSTPIVLDGTNGMVSGLTNKTLGGTDFATKGQAATEEQLDATQVNLKTILGGEAKNENGNVSTANIGDTGKGNVHEAIKSVKETAEKGWKLQANEGAEEKVAAGETVNFKDGKNIKVTRDGKNITVATSDDVEFAHVKADSVEATSVVAESVIAGNSVLTTDGLKIGADSSPNQVSLTTAGLNNGGNKIANVAKGTVDTDAVNVSQLNPIAKALNTSINLTTGAIEAPVFTVTKADGTKHPAVGTVQDALDKVGEEVTKGLNIVADNGSSEKVNLGDTVKYTSKDKNIVTTSGTGKAIDFSLAEKVTIGKDAANGGKPVVIDGKEGIVSGLTNQALGGADFATKGQAATEEQLNETQANLAKLLGGNAANDKGNVATNDIGGTGKDNVHDAIAAVKETVDKGWNLKANDEADSDSENIASGDTVTVKQGKNIRVKRSGKELTIGTSDDVEFGTVSATTVIADSFISGNSVLSGEGLKIGADGSPSQVSLTNAGLNNGGNKIANVAKGTDDTDAVNVAQLNEQLAATEKTTTVVAGKNVTVSEKVDGNNTEYTVNADKTTLSQAANGAVKVSEGTKDADGVTDYALDLTDEAKADIAKGVAAKDAVDNKGLTFAADNGTTGAKKLGDSLSVKGDGNILTRADENGIGFSLADKITVGKAGKGNKPLVIDGTAGLISGLSNTTLGGADFATKGQAASEEQLNAAQANLANLLGGNAANNNGNVTTTDIGGTGKDNVHDAIAAVKETADKGWNLKANDETSSEKIGAGDTVTFKEGKNVKVSHNGKNITVATSDDVSFDKVTVGGNVLSDNGLTVGNGKAGKPVSLTKDGLNNGGNKVTDIAAGEADTDAVNVAQLKAAAAKATSKVDSGNDNIVVTPEQNADGSTTYKVATAPDLKADSLTAGDTVVNNDGVKVGDKVALGKDGLKAGDVNITADGINAGNKAISNVAAGVKDTDAANVGQLNRLTAAAKTEVEAGTNIASVTSKEGANGQTVYTVNADGASVSAGSDNIVVTKGNKDANNVTDYAVDLSKAVKADIAKGVAAKDAVDNKGISFAGDSGKTVANKLGDTVAVKGDANITTTAGANGIQVGLNKDLKVDSVKAGDTVVNNDGVKVGDKVALGKDGLKAGDVNITADGINAGNKAISNVAAGVKDTDAANVGQLNRLTAAAKTEVEAGTNIASVTSKEGANGQTVYTVNADGASVSAGSDNIVVTKGNKDANNVTDYAVDLSKAVKADIAKGVAAKDAVDNKGISFAGDSGKTVANKLGDTVAVKGDANITTTAGANGIQVGLNKDLKVDSVKAGDTVVNNNGVNVGDKVALGKDGLKAGDVNITAEGINAGGKKVTGVAAGTVAAGSTDAVNGGQLHQVYELIGSNGSNVNTAPPSVEADGKAGLGNIKNITLVDNSTNPNVTNVMNETKIAQSNGYSLVTYNVEDQGMYVTNNVIEAVGRMNEQGIKFFHTNDGKVNPDVQAHNSEDSSASGAYATAVGYQATSKGTNAIAIGKGAKANAENTIAIGTGNIVSGKNSGAIGDPTVVSGNSSYSIGNNNNVSADNAYALGSDIKATVKDSVYLGDRAQTQGIHTADAAKGEAYTYGGLNDKAVAGKAGSAAAANKVAGVVTVGNGTDETRQVQGVAAGVVSADSTDAINGSQLYYTNQAIANVATQATAAKTEVTAGKNVVVNQTTGNSGQTVYNVATADKLDVTSVTAGGVTVNAQGVSIAAPTANNPANTVSLSPIGLNNGGQRITNVAPAKEGTDAVNLNQLAGMGNALQNNIERVGKKAYAGVAGAIAHSSIPQVTRPGATGLSVGSGYYGGQSAVAVGLSTMSDNGNWVFKGSFSANTDGHLGVGAGALYQW